MKELKMISDQLLELMHSLEKENKTIHSNELEMIRVHMAQIALRIEILSKQDISYYDDFRIELTNALNKMTEDHILLRNS